jgi:hypothetical protein
LRGCSATPGAVSPDAVSGKPFEPNSELCDIQNR